MELANHDLAALGAADLIRVSATIPRGAPSTFALLTATLVFPLSFAVLAHSLFTHPILRRLKASDYATAGAAQWVTLFGYQFLYVIFLFTFSLVSTAAAVFTVASLYAAKPASIASSLAALPTILPRLLRTFLWVALLMLAYNALLVVTLLLLIVAFVPSPSAPPSLAFLLILLFVVLVFLAIHVYISALWHLASVISVLEPICGLAAMSKSRQLLQGRTRTAAVLVVSYFAACGVTAGFFHSAVVKGPGEEGSLGLSLPGKILVGAVMVSVLVIVNLLGLLVQSVFYYACKAFHNQQIDRTQLYEHLGGYLGEYVPLKSNIQMENL